MASKVKTFEDLVGHSITSVDGLQAGSEKVIFTLEDGRQCRMWHRQDCCELVTLEDVCGDSSVLIDQRIISAEETTDECGNAAVSGTWTFYHLRTNAGTLSLRWYGESNGYYSESVDFEEVERDC